MPADFESGMFVREPAWHQMGNVIGDWPGDWAEACRHADLEWDIEVKPVYSGTLSPDGVQIGLVDGWQAIHRSDTQEVLDVAPPTYEPLSNAEFGQIIEAIVGALEGKARYETLVVLKGGRLIAVTLQAPAREVPGDPSPLIPYLAGWTSHDRSAACKVGATQVRVVCANTQTFADMDMDRRGSGFVIQHRRGMAERLEEVAGRLSQAFAGIDQMHHAACELAAIGISRTQVEEFVEYWIPTSSDMTARRLANVHDARARFWSVYEGEDGKVTMEGVRGNAWGLYCAATETADWFTPYKSWDTLIHRQLIVGDTRKSGALVAVRRVLR